MQSWLWLLLVAVAILVAVLVVVVSGLGGGRGDARAIRAQHDAPQVGLEPTVPGPPATPLRISRPSTEAGASDRIAESDTQALPDVLVDPAVLVEKRARRLTVFSEGRPVKRYRVALGREPIGDKEREGDLRTPEGEFYVCTRNTNSKYHRAIGLSYPNEEDAERGLAAGLITKREYRTILDATHHMTRPPWKTALGGEIMIHGGGAESDWTEGCIAVSDAEVEELFRALPLGAPVEIAP